MRLHYEYGYPGYDYCNSTGKVSLNVQVVLGFPSPPWFSLPVAPILTWGLCRCQNALPGSITCSTSSYMPMCEKLSYYLLLWSL